MKKLVLLLFVLSFAFTSCKKCETCYKYEFESNTLIGVNNDVVRTNFNPNPLEIQEFCGKELKEIREFQEELNERNRYTVTFWICEPLN